MGKKLEGKVAIVTGSSRGIGKATALAFAKEGASVVVAARSVEHNPKMPGTIYKTAEEIKAMGGTALPIKLDLTKDEDIANVIQKTIDEFGKVDILVNNAGVVYRVPPWEFPIKRWDIIMNVDLRGTFLCCQGVLPYMMKQNSGSIINFSSVAAQSREIPVGIAYAVAKAGVERLTWELSEDLKQEGYNISVNALRPHYTASEGALVVAGEDYDTSTWQRPEMWAGFCVFLATRNAEQLTGRMFLEADVRLEAYKAGWIL